VKIAIGVGLVAIAIRQRRRMGRPRKPKKPPKWQEHVDNMSPWFAFGLAPAVQPIQPRAQPIDRRAEVIDMRIFGLHSSVHHVVRDQAAFTQACREAIAAAANGLIVTFGVNATFPATKYSYIQPGPALNGMTALAVKSFVEKPDAKTAKRYVLERYLWNSGNFMFRADVMLGELARFEPDIAAAWGAFGSIFTATPNCPAKACNASRDPGPPRTSCRCWNPPGTRPWMRSNSALTLAKSGVFTAPF